MQQQGPPNTGMAENAEMSFEQLQVRHVMSCHVILGHAILKRARREERMLIIPLLLQFMQ